MPNIKDHLQYGIEIEGYYGTDWLDEHGVDSYHGGTENEDLHNYRLEQDGSLHSYYSGMNSAEFISPILRYREFDQDMNNLRDMLKDVPFKADNTCGLHVTFSLDNVDITQYFTFGRVKTAREKYLAKHPSSRYSRDYATPIRTIKQMFGRRHSEFNMGKDSCIEWRAIEAGNTGDIEDVIKTVKTALDTLIETLETKAEPEVVTYAVLNDPWSTTNSDFGINIRPMHEMEYSHYDSSYRLPRIYRNRNLSIEPIQIYESIGTRYFQPIVAI